MPEHDQAYKLLFSHPEMVRDLLEGFVGEQWLAQLDYNSLERVNSTYVSDDLRDRTGDVVWRVRWGEGWLYIYLLIEFQSTVEHYMAVRILTYVGLLYQDLIRARGLAAEGRLPPVLPIVLYNGAQRWNAPETMAALLEPGPRALESYRPRARYVLIDEGRYRESDLAPLRNLAAALFRLENSLDHADVREVVRLLKEWLASPEQRSLRRAFAVWIGRVILGKLPGGPVTDVEELEDMSTLLDVRIQEWAEEAKRRGLQEGREQGLEQGLEQGREQGLRQGEAALLERQLRKRFGDLPADVVTRLQQAHPAQLEQWGERLLEAESLEAVFSAD